MSLNILGSPFLKSVTITNGTDISIGILEGKSLKSGEATTFSGDKLREFITEAFKPTSKIRSKIGTELVVSNPVFDYNDSASGVSVANVNVKVAAKVFGVAGIDGLDANFASAANLTAQNLDLGEIIPGMSFVIGSAIKCLQTPADDTDPTTMTFLSGTASAGNQLIASTTCDETGEVKGSAIGAAPLNALTSTDGKVWINAVPGVNWDTLEAGIWVAIIAYIDLGG